MGVSIWTSSTKAAATHKATLIAIHISAKSLHRSLINSPINSYRITDKMSGTLALPESLKKSVENSKAEYVNLGKSGLRVSIPILGAMSIGHPEWAPWVIDEEKVNALLQVLNSANY